jgi:Domain of unknown function (DUF4129)
VRALLPALAVLALVGVVAVASTGSTPSGSADGRPPADFLLDTFFSLSLLLFVPALALLVYGLAQRKEIAREIASGRYRRTSVWTYLVLMGALSLAVYLRITDFRFGLRGDQGEVVDVGSQDPSVVPEGVDTAERVYEPEFAWIPALVVLALAVAGIAAFVIASRRSRHVAAMEGDVAEHVAETLEDTLEDLRAEPDPRRAVIASWARLERALASSGLPRRPAETPEEYVARILGKLEVDPAPVRTLTDLFETAKFSQHEVDEAMRESAIVALVRIRDELREAARRRREEQEGALEAPEPAVTS